MASISVNAGDVGGEVSVMFGVGEIEGDSVGIEIVKVWVSLQPLTSPLNV